MLLDVILAPPELHPAVHELIVLVNAAEEVSAHLRAQAHQQPDMPATLIFSHPEIIQ